MTKQMKIESNVMTLAEVADYLRCHPSTIYRLMKAGDLPGFKVGSDWRFNRASIDQWRRSQENAAQCLVCGR